MSADGLASAVWADLPGDQPALLPDEFLDQLPEDARAAALATSRETIHILPQHLLASLANFFCDDPSRERLALLAGRIWSLKPAATYLVEVTSHHPVPAADASAVHVSMSAADWPALWPTLDLQARNRIIGWAHSHPTGGLFFSPTDHATQASWFSHPSSLALVFDPKNRRYTAFTGPQARPTQVYSSFPAEIAR